MISTEHPVWQRKDPDKVAAESNWRVLRERTSGCLPLQKMTSASEHLELHLLFFVCVCVFPFCQLEILVRSVCLLQNVPYALRIC